MPKQQDLDSNGQPSGARAEPTPPPPPAPPPARGDAQPARYASASPPPHDHLAPKLCCICHKVSSRGFARFGIATPSGCGRRRRHLSPARSRDRFRWCGQVRLGGAWRRPAAGCFFDLLEPLEFPEALTHAACQFREFVCSEEKQQQDERESRPRCRPGP